MLWPKITIEKGGYNLAATGAVGRNALDEELVAVELLATLRRDYAGQVEARYKLTDTAVLNDEELLAAIGRKRGAVLGGGKINLQKAAEIVIHDYRNGILGRITLETPEEFLVWAAEAAIAEAARQERKTRKGRRGAAPSAGESASDESADEIFMSGDEEGADGPVDD
jgi:ribosome biogenesis GTPase A